MPAIFKPGQVSPTVTTVTVPSPIPLRPTPVPAQTPQQQAPPQPQPAPQQQYTPKQPPPQETEERQEAIIMPHSGVGLTNTANRPEKMMRDMKERYARNPAGSTYREMSQYLGNRPERRLSGNKRLRRVGGDIHVVLHSTPVVIAHPDGNFTVDYGGHNSVTSHQTIRDYSPASTYMRKGGVIYHPTTGEQDFSGPTTVSSTGRPITINPRWLTSDVTGLAHSIKQNGSYDQLPILGDALMDAGVDDHDIIKHTETPAHGSSWLVDRITEAAPHRMHRRGVADKYQRPVLFFLPQTEEQRHVVDHPEQYARVGGLTKVVSGHYQYRHPSGKKFVITRNTMRNGREVWLSHRQDGPTADHYGVPFSSGKSLSEAVLNCDPKGAESKKYHRFRVHYVPVRYAATDAGFKYASPEEQNESNKLVAGPEGRHPVSVVTARYPLDTDERAFSPNPLTHPSGAVYRGKPRLAADPEMKHRIVEVAAGHGLQNADFQKEVIGRYLRDLPKVFGSKVADVRRWVEDPTVSGRQIIGTKDFPGYLEQAGVPVPGRPGTSWHTVVPEQRSGRVTGLHVNKNPLEPAQAYHGITHYRTTHKRLLHVRPDGSVEDVTDYLSGLKRPTTDPGNQPGLEEKVTHNTIYTPNVTHVSHNTGEGLREITPHLRRWGTEVAKHIANAVAALGRTVRSGGERPTGPERTAPTQEPHVTPKPTPPGSVAETEVPTARVPAPFPETTDPVEQEAEALRKRKTRKVMKPRESVTSSEETEVPVGDHMDPRVTARILTGRMRDEEARRRASTERRAKDPLTNTNSEVTDRSINGHRYDGTPERVEPHRMIVGTRLHENLKQLRGEVKDARLHSLIDQAIRGPGQGEGWGDKVWHEGSVSQPFRAIRSRLDQLSKSGSKNSKRLREWRDAYQWDRVGSRLQADSIVHDSLSELLGGTKKGQFASFLQKYVPGIREGQASTGGGKAFHVAKDFVQKMDPGQRAAWKILREKVKGAKLPGVNEREVGGGGGQRALDEQILRSLFRNALRQGRISSGKIPTALPGKDKTRIEQYRRRYYRRPPSPHHNVIARIRQHFKKKTRLSATTASKTDTLPPAGPAKAPAGGIVVRESAVNIPGETYHGGTYTKGGRFVQKIG